MSKTKEEDFEFFVKLPDYELNDSNSIKINNDLNEINFLLSKMKP